MNRENHVLLTRLLKFAVSATVFLGDQVTAFIKRGLGLAPDTPCVVIYYHSVRDTERHLFARQLDQLLKHAHPISVHEVSQLGRAKRSVVVTFDDGFQNFVDCAMPELLTRQIPATMFVMSDLLGNTFGPQGLQEPLMSMEQIRELPQRLVTIGSHSRTHPFLPSLEVAEAEKEILLSRRSLEDKLGREITLFSFPYGGLTPKLVDLCRMGGYERVFSTLPHLSSKTKNEFVTGRVRVDPTDWPLEYRCKIMGCYRWLPWAFELKRTLFSLLRLQDRSEPSSHKTVATAKEY